VVHMETQKIRNKEQSPRVAELRQELRRKIAAHAPNAGAHATAILGLTLYRRTAPSPCYPAMYEPSLNVFVQGRKRIALAGTTYLCDESTFVLSSIDVPIVSQIVAASEDVPLLSLLLKLDMAPVREILSQEEFHAPDGSSPVRGIAIGKTTVDLLKPCCRLLDLLEAPEDIPFLSNLIQREIVYRLLRGPHGERRVAVPALVLMVGSTYLLYLGASQQPALLVPLYVLAGAGSGAAVLAPLIMVRIFPPAVRFSGVSVSFNVAQAVFGGLQHESIDP
jgi:hypothetical protein